MHRLRQIAPLLSLLLTLIVGGEMTDVLPCADVDCGAWNALLHSDAPPPDDGDHGDGESSSACLCQALFVSTAMMPAASAPAPDGGALFRADPARVPAPFGRVLHPPPKG